MLLALAPLLLPGCAMPFTHTRSTLTAQSQTHSGNRLSSQFDHAVYSFGDRDTMTVILVQGPLEQPIQAATIRMFWRPRAGSTPLTATATNASIQYIIFTPSDPEPASTAATDRLVGVYSGAGFFFPTSHPGDNRLRGELWQAHMRLADASPGFNDLLGQAVLTGEVAAVRDDAAVARLLHQLNTRVTEHLGYPRLVTAQP